MRAWCVLSFAVAFISIMTHNYKDTYGRAPQEESNCIGFTSAHAPSAGIARTGRHPPAPRGGDRSPLSRQRVLRSERSGAGQVRDAAKRPAGGTFGGGGGSGLWSVPPGLLCHSGVVPARGPAGAAAAQARTEAASQAQRRSDGGPGPGRYRRPEGCSRARNWRRFWRSALASRRIRGVSCGGCFRICGRRKKNFADRRSRKAGRHCSTACSTNCFALRSSAL